MKKLIIPIIVILIQSELKSQTSSELLKGSDQALTATPFLTINPDPRGAGLGDAGVASLSDAASINWNIAKVAKSKNQFGVLFSVSPWLLNLNVKDINMFYISGFNKFGNLQGIGYSIRYFNYGELISTGNDVNATNNGTINPYELSIDVGYSRLLSKRFSLGLTFRYIRSDLTQGLYNTQDANAFAIDIGGLWNTELLLFKKKLLIGLGFNISNFGTKISYGTGDNEKFLPTNFKIGSSFRYTFTEYHKLEFLFDINKLLVPLNTVSNSGLDIFSAVGKSLGDKIETVRLNFGLEYKLFNLLALRTGYSHEDVSVGNRQYITLGTGLFYKGIQLDISTLFSTNNVNSAISKSFRFSLSYLFSTKKFLTKYEFEKFDKIPIDIKFPKKEKKEKDIQYMEDLKPKE